MSRKSFFKVLIAAIMTFTMLMSGCSEGTPETSVSVETTAQTTESAITTIAETTAGTTAETVPLKEGTIETVVIDSACIAKNIVGDSSERSVYIYLPPTYGEGDKNYPVVYFLHGYGDDSESFLKSAAAALNVNFNDGGKEFIFVALDGNIKSGGSFYVNSSSLGDWEDFVTEEVVGYLDSNYRTIADSESRCISGYSMGGFGAINAAFHRPDVFSSLLVFCPGIYADGDIKSMWDSWDGWTDVKLSYGQAFAPNNDGEKQYGSIPSFSGTDEDNEIVALWDNGYGNWEAKIQTFIEKGIPLKGVQIAYGSLDSFTWIPGGSQFLSEKLTENGIENELKEFSNGHVVPYGCIPDYYVPFCEANLTFED